MTKEECIADLKSINATGMECIDYAIKALEQQSEDCVSKAELMKLYHKSRPTLATNVYEFGEKLQALPPVTPIHGMCKGRWILIDKESNKWKCSHCKELGKDDWWQLNSGTPEDNKMNYCPHCGAEMEGEDNNDKSNIQA